MKKIREHVAGIDIGSKQLFVGIEGRPVKVFNTFTEDMEALSDYLIEHQIETVAMEATGVYWVILFDILKAAKIDVWLVDGRSTKQVPGRKTDVKDCQWIAQLHSYGLLNKCFIPDKLVAELRSYQRLREDHIRSSSMHINHMQKALTLMNIRLKEVLSQLHGASGMKVIRAILQGERNAEKLTKLCSSRILDKKREQVLKSLKGHYSDAGIFALAQAVKAYDFYTAQIGECDKKIEEVLKRINQENPPKPNSPEPKEKRKRKPIRHHKPDVENMDKYLLDAFNQVDATVLPGITDYSWLQLFSELGNDLSKWKTEKHFTSWLGLSPKQNHSGKMKRNYKVKGQPKAGLIFKQAAVSLLNSKDIALGAFGRKIRAKKGGLVAIKAVARKLAELYWKLHVKGLEYIEKGIIAYKNKIMQHKQRTFIKMANELGVSINSLSRN